MPPMLHKPLLRGNAAGAGQRPRELDLELQVYNGIRLNFGAQSLFDGDGLPSSRNISAIADIRRALQCPAVLLCFFAALLLVAGAGGLFLAAWHFHWRLALASFGVLGLATVYISAAKPGRPL